MRHEDHGFGVPSKKPATHVRSKGASRTGDAPQGSWFERRVKLPLQALFTVYILEVLLRRKALPPSKDGRIIPLKTKHDKALIDERRGHAYISNSIRSARYTVWDFLPKQFFFQATRLANFYFICIGIPQAIPGFSTTGNYTTILPLCFFLLLTICKEGYDDFRRHRLDKIENNAYATVLRAKDDESYAQVISKSIVHTVTNTLGSLPLLRKVIKTSGHEHKEKDLDEDDTCSWEQIKWHDIKVGDLLKLKRDDAVPADIVLLYGSGEDGTAYVETMALDGETNLKSKQAPSALRDCHNIAGLRCQTAEFILEDPNRNLYEFNGKAIVEGKSFPLTLNNVVLRGSVIRNTGVAIGMVINTGEECKIRMNANHHPKAKKPRLERYTNQVVLTLIVYVIVLSVGCSVGYLLWQARTERRAWYLNNAYVPFKQIIIGFMIMFNNVIPLALYISLEIVKIGQMLMTSGDVDMYDEDSNTPMTCNTNTILENLGQVCYVLSDKTGTLTQNVMKFRGMTVAGTAWVHNDTLLGESGPKASASMHRKSSEQRKNDTERDHKPSIIVQETDLDARLTVTPHLTEATTLPSMNRNSADQFRQLQNRGTTKELMEYIRSHPDAVFSQKARRFIFGVALCHTALPEYQSNGIIDFQASSPDEVALVRAAQELGVLVVSRSSQSITLRETNQNVGNEHQVYGILDVIEFSSKRKRMSIIVRAPDGKIRLLCKGADNVIVPRLSQATLAARKSQEVRRSIQIERDLRRKSEQQTPRTSIGGRPSLAMLQHNSLEILAAPKRTTLEVPRLWGGEKSTRSSFERRSTEKDKFAFLSDSAIQDEATVFSRCFKHLDEFATEGLRTLLFAQRELSEDEYTSWKKLYQDAVTALVDRQEKIEEAGDVIEQNFDLLGASAIEDKLQEGVPETIDKLRRANMKIWMLTGDKRETAINVAHSASICLPDSEILILDSSKGDLEAQLRGLAEQLQVTTFHAVAVIDGQTLSEVEVNGTLTNIFYSLIPTIDSVICCRASPAQKASIVKAIRSRMPGLTLAVGDGANDVAMITASHVGVGISGKEGLQAARVADYSIAQFRFLQRLLLVHGHYNYIRTAKFILWTYFKEMFFYMVQALYQRYNGYSGSSLYENWSLTVLNTLFTSLCVIVPGMFEQDLKPDTLLAVPELYAYGQRNKGLNIAKYLVWMVLATVEGMLVWFIVWSLYGKHNRMGDNGAFAIGDLCFSLAIMWTNIKLLILETHYKTRIVIVSFLITVSGWWAWNAFLGGVYSDNLSPYDIKGGFSKGFGKDPNWWLVLLLTLAILTTIEVVLKATRRRLAIAGLWPLWKQRRRSCTSDNKELDVELWQETERDHRVHEGYADPAPNECDD